MMLCGIFNYTFGIIVERTLVRFIPVNYGLLIFKVHSTVYNSLMKVITLLLIFFTLPSFAAENNALFSASILGKTERVKSLLADGIDVNSATATGRTAIMAASFNGNLRVVKILLSYGADVNISDKSGSTALMDALIFGREDLVKLLITAGADAMAEDKQNVSVIDKAKKTKYKNIIKILEEHAAAIEENADDEENDE